MPDLTHTLQGHDLGFLKIVARAWGIDLDAPDAYTAVPRLVNEMLDSDLAGEVIGSLPSNAAAALAELLENDGRLPWAMFSRRYGEVRGYGAARRDREKPDENPISPAEVLWYRALIGKAFLNLAPEPQEYAYIPDDLLEFMVRLPSAKPRPAGRAASPNESAHPTSATDRILDDCCTLLAAIRTNRNPADFEEEDWTRRLPFLKALLKAAGLILPGDKIDPEAVRKFLEASRGESLARLVNVWLNSKTLNELRLVPGLVFEGTWRNDPLAARQAVLEMVGLIPRGTWWNLSAFISGMRDQRPDFQRPAGDYDSWFIRRQDSTTFLRGISSWDEVDGALLRYLLTGPLFWLGLVELASDKKGGNPTAFRLSNWAGALLSGKAPALSVEREQIEITPDHWIKAAPLTSRAIRYQIARFCDWAKSSGGVFLYQVTPTSLEKALQQGLSPAHLIKFLHRYAQAPLPPKFLRALERWEKFGTEAGFQKGVLLRTASPEVLEALKKSKAGRSILETLTPTIALLRPGSEDNVRKALAELGYLSDNWLPPGKQV